MSGADKSSSGTPLEPFAELTVPSSPEFLALLRSHVTWFCQRCGFESLVTSRIVLSVVEAATNVMRHAYSGEPGDTITLRCTEMSMPPEPETSDDSKDAGSKDAGLEGRGGIRIEILDHGEHVSANECRGREPGGLEPGGLGVHVITSCMDRVEREPRDGGGTRLVLTKFFDKNTLDKEPSAPVKPELNDD